MINKSIRCKDAKVNEYIEALEDELVSRDISGIENFIRNVNLLSIKLSEEVGYLAEGRFAEIQILSNDKDDKLVDRILALVSKVDHFSKVSELAKALNKQYIVEDNSKVADAPEGTVEDMIEKKKNSRK